MNELPDARSERIRDLRALADHFRSKADETQLGSYIDLMRSSAVELERLADRIEAEMSGRPSAACA